MHPSVGEPPSLDSTRSAVTPVVVSPDPKSAALAVQCRDAGC